MRDNETVAEYDDRMNREAEREFNARNGQGRRTGQEIVLTKEIAHADALPMIHPLEREPEDFKRSLAVRGQNRTTLVTWLKDALKPGLDYGKIHFVKKSQCSKGTACTDAAHFTKDTLFRPGAEKICGMLGVLPTYPNLPRYEEAALSGAEIRSILLRCQIVSANGMVVSEGVGARGLAQDYGDLNKALKMAKKSCLIDAVLGMAGLSEIFSHPDTPPGPPGSDEPDLARVPMGRFKGTYWADVTQKYLEGVIASPEAPPVMKQGARAELDRRPKTMSDIEFDDDIPY